ncbi:MAG: amidohydrolase family protein [Nevskia sp.]
MKRLHRLLPLLAALLVSTGARADVIAIKDAEVRTLARAGTYSRATVLIRNERIEAVGPDLAIPANATVIDGRGLILTPGLFAAETELGLKEIDGVDETNDVASEQPRFSAALDVADALNPRSLVIPVNRVDGITSAVTLPGSKKGGSLIAGQGAIISMAGALAHGDEHFLLRPRAVMVAALGEFAADLSGGSRPAAMAKLREAFEEAKSGGLRLGPGLSREAQLGPLDVAALKPVLAGETPLLLHVDRASDIRAAIRLADDYGLRLIVSGGAEAWLVAKELAEHRVPVLIDPTEDLPGRFETLHARQDNAQLLFKAGVPFAFTGGGEGGPRNLRQVAGIAAAWGLPKDIALAAITLYPAEIFGLANTLGGIEPGKVANLVLWDGDPLELMTSAKQVWIDGAAMPMTSRQTLLRDKYLQRLRDKAGAN